MSGNTSIVRDTRIVQVTSLKGPENRSYKKILVEYPGFSARPGQFIMIKKDCGPTNWAYPYMVQQVTEQGAVVYAVEGTSLFDAEEETPLIVWGPSGNPVRADEKTIILLESAAAFLAAPVLNEQPDCRYIALASEKESGFLKNFSRGTYVADVKAMAEELRKQPYDTVIAALNVETAQELVSGMPEMNTGNMLFFASTKISCGVNGCKSCYLHSKTVPLGISVCCSGPYLPYDKIDFELDKRCFHTFE